MASGPNRGIYILMIVTIIALLFAYWFNFLGGKALYSAITGF